MWGIAKENLRVFPLRKALIAKSRSMATPPALTHVIDYTCKIDVLGGVSIGRER